MFDYRNKIKYLDNKYWSVPIRKPESNLEKEVNNSISDNVSLSADPTNHFEGYYSVTPMIVHDRPFIGAVLGGLLKGTYIPSSDVSSVFKYLSNFDKKVTATHEVVHQLNQREGRPQHEYLVEVQTERMKDLLPIIYHQTY